MLGHTLPLFRTYLDRTYDGAHWLHRDLDVSALAGRTGKLVFRNAADRTRAAVSFGAANLVSAGAPAATPEVNLFESLSTARVSDFDLHRTEDYPNFENFGTPGGGKPAFIWWDNPALPTRLSLVTIAGARARFDLASLPARPSLVFAVSHGTGVGDGVRGKIFWNDELIYDRIVTPSMRNWSEVVIQLPAQRECWRHAAHRSVVGSEA